MRSDGRLARDALRSGRAAAAAAQQRPARGLCGGRGERRLGRDGVHPRARSRVVRARVLAGHRQHLDGARVFNAAVKLGIPVSDITQHFDSVSICLSKGLATPVGSVLVGSRSLIDEARKWRKMVGGGMRQAGVIAAAGIYALENHVDRLAEDHAKAAHFAEGVSQLESISVAAPETNMVMVETDKFRELSSFLADNDVRVSSPRFVFHRDISSSEVETLIDLVRRFDQNA